MILNINFKNIIYFNIFLVLDDIIFEDFFNWIVNNGNNKIFFGIYI